MKLYTLERTQFIPAKIKDVWEFFSSPKNLSSITPDDMGFVVTSSKDEEMYSGQIIEYTVSPLLGIPLKWITEIKHCSHEKSFVDEQRFGPFKFWHHTHHFELRDNGVMMTDTVRYMLPLGILGRLAHAITVKNRLSTIFEFRYAKVDEVFGVVD